MAGDGGFEIAPRLALEVIGDAARDMRGLAGDADRFRLQPDDAARVRPVDDACSTPRSGTVSPGAKAIGFGSRARRTPIQAAWRSANSRAAFSVPRAGMVNSTSREAARTRKV